MLRILIVVSLLLPLCSIGCQSNSGATPRARHPDEPKSKRKATILEDRAIASIRAANKQIDDDKRKELYEKGLTQMQQAQTIYERELRDDPGSPEKQRALQQEIDRLSERIDTIHRQRPLD